LVFHFVWAWHYGHRRKEFTVTIYQTDGHWFTGGGNGYITVEVNIPPASVYVTTSLFGHSGGGTSYAGIQQYRRRLDSGADQDIDFGSWPSWPPSIFDHISSVTFALAEGSDQQGWLYGRMDYWE
jgi:hypothetical protein